MKIKLFNVGNYLASELTEILRAIKDGKVHFYMWPGEDGIDNDHDKIGKVEGLVIDLEDLSKSEAEVSLEFPHRFVETDGFLLVKSYPEYYAVYQENREEFERRAEYVNKMRGT